MAITTRWWIAAAAAIGAAGIGLLATDVAQAVGGLLAGSGITAVPALALIDRRVARLDQERAALSEKIAQADAAHAANAGQRQRILATVEHMVNGRMAVERARVERQILHARMEGYKQGAVHALTGALDPVQPPVGADVVSLDTRRPAPAGTPR